MKTFVSLFAGIGGFDLALEREGFECVGQCEIDKFARSVLDKHWPEVPKHDDVSTLKAGIFQYPDIVTFGSPCQDLSIGGRGKGLAGQRSGLFVEAVRYIREVQEATNGEYPKAVIWENVPGAFTTNKGEDFATVLKLLVGGDVQVPKGGWKTAGDYAGIAFGPQGSVEWRVLDSQYFGVPQRRRRVFLVYHPRGDRAGQILFEREDMPKGIDKSNKKEQATPERIARDVRNSSIEMIRPTSHEQDSAVAYVKTRRAHSKTDFESWQESKISATMNSFDMGAARFTTIIKSKQPRRLMPIECERLQGFPDNWTLGLSDTQRYKTLGNAVTVNVVQWIANRL